MLHDFLNRFSGDQLKVIAALAQALGTVVAALVVSVAGGLISGHYNRNRNLQDKESQWRDHAIELTKLDLQRKLETRRSDLERKPEITKTEDVTPLRPSILDFLANYRDLQELGNKSPKQLCEDINKGRISKP